MNAVAMMCVAVLAGGIDVGWQRRPEGGMEYIIQLNPEAIEVLQRGREIQSDVPAEAGNVRAYRIKLGQEKLPREAPPLETPPTPPTRESGANSPLDGATKASPPLPQEQPKQEETPSEPSKPWLVLSATFVGLLASLVANVYIGWIAYGLRQRIRASHEDLPPTDSLNPA